MSLTNSPLGWDRPDLWSDEELARWCWFIMSNGFTMRVNSCARGANLIRFDWDHEVPCRPLLMAVAITASAQSFDRVCVHLDGYITKFKTNASSDFYRLSE